MTNEERIALIRDSIGKIQDVSLGVDVSWLCRYALQERKTADELFSKLETERAILDDVKELAQTEIDGLRVRLQSPGPLAVEVFHPKDTDGPYTLAEAYLEYQCVKCGATLCPDGSDEAIDGLTEDLNGHFIKCVCGAEYIGYTIDTPKLSLFVEPKAADVSSEDTEDTEPEDRSSKDYDFPCGY
jgi:DNA-directed RNA polymerase subunit RPC12/RpoP